jgi:hypothetical protein
MKAGDGGKQLFGQRWGVNVEQKNLNYKQGLTEQLSVRQTCWIVFVLRLIVDEVDVEDEMRVGKGGERMQDVFFYICRTGQDSWDRCDWKSLIN